MWMQNAATTPRETFISIQENNVVKTKQVVMWYAVLQELNKYCTYLFNKR